MQQELKKLFYRINKFMGTVTAVSIALGIAWIIFGIIVICIEHYFKKKLATLTTEGEEKLKHLRCQHRFELSRATETPAQRHAREAAYIRNEIQAEIPVLNDIVIKGLTNLPKERIIYSY